MTAPLHTGWNEQEPRQICLLVYHWFGAQRGLEFLTGYLIEKALSVDNIFVFLVVFSFFAVPGAYQHRVLFWGILGALVMRAAFIVTGAALLQRFHWVVYAFGAFLIVTGVKLLLHRDAEVHPERNLVCRLFRRVVPAVIEYRGPRFTVVQDGRRFATPLLAVLVVVEATDVAFAVDSIPAVFAVTRDPFIVYTSNIFAILGLRAIYFLLADVMGRLPCGGGVPPRRIDRGLAALAANPALAAAQQRRGGRQLKASQDTARVHGRERRETNESKPYASCGLRTVSIRTRAIRRPAMVATLIR